MGRGGEKIEVLPGADLLKIQNPVIFSMRFDHSNDRKILFGPGRESPIGELRPPSRDVREEEIYLLISDPPFASRGPIEIDIDFLGKVIAGTWVAINFAPKLSKSERHIFVWVGRAGRLGRRFHLSIIVSFLILGLLRSAWAEGVNSCLVPSLKKIVSRACEARTSYDGGCIGDDLLLEVRVMTP